MTKFQRYKKLDNYSHYALIKGIYFDYWGIPLIKSKAYIKELWNKNYSKYKSIDDFEFTQKELEMIYKYAQEEARDIDEACVLKAYGKKADYSLIINQIERYLNVEPKFYYELVEENKDKDLVFRAIRTRSVCTELGKKFIENFDKIYRDHTSTMVDTWIEEMQECLNEAFKVRYNKSHREIYGYAFRTYFFNVGDGYDESIIMDDKEKYMYDELIFRCYRSREVRQNVESIFRRVGMTIPYSQGKGVNELL